jgi:hypothetical protein
VQKSFRTRHCAQDIGFTLTCGGREVSNERQNDAREVMKKTPEELVMWAVERNPEDSYRQSIVKLELERRVAVAQIKAARWMFWSVLAIWFTGIVAALAWMYPHIAQGF